MKIIYILAFIILVSSCKRLPGKKFKPIEIEFVMEIKNDSLYIELQNPVKCALRFNSTIKDSSLQRELETFFPLLAPPLLDTSIALFWPSDKKPGLTYYFGNGKKPTNDSVSTFPFPKNRSYKIVQGYHGSHSHQSDFSRYALDFDLKVKDTVCAAEKGVVVGCIEEYKDWGKSRKWRPFANYIILFHPQKNLFTQYVHLDHYGSLVEIGDTVATGQPIGISGMTGFTSIAHLHFNVLKSGSTGFKSIPTTFGDGVPGKDLRHGRIVKK